MTAFSQCMSRAWQALSALVVCASGAVTPAHAQFATGSTGAGAYKNDIYWLSWGAVGTRVYNNTSRSFQFTLGGRPVDLTCTLNNLRRNGGAALSGNYATVYRPGGYFADTLPFVYNLGGSGSSNTFPFGLRTENGETLDFSISCSATLDGLPFEIAGLVLADAETSSKNQVESVGVTLPRGGSMQILEAYAGASCSKVSYGYETTTDLSGRTRYEFSNMHGNDCAAGSGTFVGYVDSTSVDFLARGGGIQAIAIGVMMPNSDFSDAPDRYGVSYHVIDRSTVGGVLPASPGVFRKLVGSEPVVGSGPDFTDRARVVAAATYLGSGVTFDGLPFANAEGALADSDDAFPSGLPATGTIGSTYTVTGACAPNGSIISAYFDLNKNGAFESNAIERRQASCQSGRFTLSWTIPVVSKQMSGTTYMRLRISDSAEGPTGISRRAGEVEDYAVSFPQNDYDMSPRFEGLPSTLVPGQVYSGLRLICSNAGPGAAIEATCAVQANLGTISNLSCPSLPRTVQGAAPDNEVSCRFDYTLPAGGTQGEVQFTGLTGARDDYNGGAVQTAGNNRTLASVPVQGPQLTLIKALSNGRDQASDQVRLQILGTGVNATVDTGGSASTVSPNAVSVRVRAGQAYTLSEIARGTTNLANYQANYLCSNTRTGAPAAPSGTGSSLSITPLGGDDISCTITNAYQPVSDLVTRKSVQGPAAYADGQTVTFQIAVENRGPATARNVSLTDLLPAELTAAAGNGAVTAGSYNAASGLWTIPELALNARATLTLIGTVKPGQGGQTIRNITTAATSDSEDPTTDGDVPEASITVTEAPALALVKSAVLQDPDGNGLANLGEKIEYRFEVINTGNVVLRDVVLRDRLLGAGNVARIETLPVGERQILGPFLYTLTQADINAGRVENSATVAGMSPTNRPAEDISGSTPSNNIPTVVTLRPGPGIAVTKSARLVDGNGNGLPDPGESLSYSFVVRNTGNVTLTGVTITDAQLSPSTITVPLAAEGLAPGAQVAVPAPGAALLRVLSQADIDAGFVVNTATARGNPPTGPPVSDVSGTSFGDNDPTRTPLLAQPKLDLVKTGALVETSRPAVAGDLIRFSFAVTNSGNVSLSNIRVEDPLLSPPLVGVVASLAPAASATLTSDYVLTQADVDAGRVANRATARGQSPTGTPTPPAEGIAEVPVPASPAITLAKRALEPLAVKTLGETVRFELVVTNRSNVTLTAPVAVSDPSADTLTCPVLPATGLAPGRTLICAATQLVTQEDLDRGYLANAAQASSSHGATPISTPEVTVQVPAIAEPSLSLVKAARWLPTDAFVTGAAVTYDYTLTNTGNVTLTGAVSISDNMIPTIACPALPAAGLAPGATLRCEATTRITVNDVALGRLTNNATGKIGTIESLPDSVTIPSNAAPALTLEKQISGTSTFAALGDLLTWRFLVTNTGNASFASDVVIHDPLLATPLVCFNSQNGARAFDPYALSPVTGRVECSATYRVNQADLDRGYVLNTAYAQSVYAPRSPTPLTVQSPTDDARAEAVARPSLVLRKTALTPAGGGIGDAVTYRLVATNTGNITLSNVTLSDPLIPVLTGCSLPTSLAPGASVSCEGSLVLSQADVDRGTVVNTASATATTPSGVPQRATSSVTYPTEVTDPELDLVKTGQFIDADANGSANAGDQIVYSFVLRNIGNVTLRDAAITDPRLRPVGVASGVTLAPGAERQFTRVHVLTQAEIDAGSQFANQATATGLPPSGPRVEDPSGPTPGTDAPTIVPLPITPTIALTKRVERVIDVNGNGMTDAGDQVVYRLEVRNTGGATLRNLRVTDALIPGFAPTRASLAPGALWVIDANAAPALRMALTQAMVDAGRVTNDAAVAATPATGGADVTDRASVTELIHATPGLDLVKTGRFDDRNGNSAAEIGETVTFTLTLRNTGNVVLSNVEIRDPMLSSAALATIPSLAPGAERQVTASLPLTQAMIDAERVENSARATGTTPSSGEIEDQSGPSPRTNAPTVVPLPSRPAIALVKSAELVDANSNSRPDAGEVVRYTFRITNTGAVTLSGLNLTDAALGLDAWPVAGSLAPGASMTVAAGVPERVLTQAHIDAGLISNRAVVTGRTPSGRPVDDTSGTGIDNDERTDLPLTAEPGLTLVKTGPATLVNAAAGDPITYRFTVQNTGNVTLSQVRVQDPLLTPSLVGLVAVLAPGASEEISAVYTLAQADIDRMSLANTATATGTTPDGTSLPPVEGQTTVTLPSGLALELVKMPVTAAISKVGDSARFNLVVTNRSNVTLTRPVTITDPTASTAICPSLPAGGLRPGASLSCSVVQVVTQADLDGGKMTNTATATSGTGTGSVTSPPAAAEIPAVRAPALSLRKTSSWSKADGFNVGTVVPYRYDVTNSGNVTITEPIVITDNKIDPMPPCAMPAGGLLPERTLTCTASYVVTVADLELGSVTNNARATDGTTTSPPDSITVPADVAPALTLVKDIIAGDLYGAVGDELTWQFRVTNTGNAGFVRDIVINDPLLDAPLVCHSSAGGVIAFGSGDQAVCTASYRVTQADLNRGFVLNTAHASSIFVASGGGLVPVQSPEDSARAEAALKPGLDLVKEVLSAPGLQSGDTLTYRLTATNSGNQTLSNVTIRDPMLGTLTGCVMPAQLDPGARLSCEGSYTLRQADLDAGDVINRASVAGTTPSGGPLTDEAEVGYAPQSGAPAIDLVKTGAFVDLDGNGVANAGDQIAYDFTLRNAGNVSLSNLRITDPRLTPALVAEGVTLAPRASQRFRRVLVLTQAHIDAGNSFANQATATGQPPSGPVVEDPSGPTPGTDAPTIVPLALDPKIELSKRIGRVLDVNGNGVTEAGDQIDYVLTVRNPGAVTLRDLRVSDVLLPGFQARRAELAPGAVWLIEVADYPALRHTLTQAEVNAGAVVNIAAVTAQPASGGAPISADAEVTHPILGRPGLDLVKTGALQDSNRDGFATAGERVLYTFTLRNIGNVTLYNVALNDPMLRDSALLTVPELAPGQSQVVTAELTLTQATVDAGQVSNTAAATGTTGGGTRVTDPSGPTPRSDGPTLVELPQRPSLALVKTSRLIDANGNGYADVGEELSYRFVVTNTGTVTLSDLVITDPMLSEVVLRVAGSLAPNAQIVVENAATRHRLTGADLDAGQVVNTAVVEGTAPSGSPVRDTSGTRQTSDDPTVTPVLQEPRLTLVKRATTPVVVGARAGDLVEFQFTLRNSGNVSLRNLELRDPLMVPSLVGTVPVLASGAEALMTASYALTQADLDAGSLRNVATAVGTPPSGTPLPPVESRTSVTLEPRLALDLVKSALTPSVSALGERAQFALRVTNRSTVTLTDPVTIQDPSAATRSCPALPAGGLAPGASITCQVEQLVSQADLDRGKMTNTATVSSGSPAGSVTSPPSSAEIPAIKRPSAVLDKQSSWTEAMGFRVGLTIPYSYKVTNTGNTTLTGPISVEDNMIPRINCASQMPSAGLAPGASLTCVADYVVTAEDVALGTLTNNATATIGTTTTPPDSVTVPQGLQPALVLEKSVVSGQGFSRVGDEIRWSFAVRNAGRAGFASDVMVNDPLLGAPFVCYNSQNGERPFEQGDSVQCGATYRVTQEDIDRGHVVNYAVASSVYAPSSSTPRLVQSPTDDARVDATAPPGLEFQKSVLTPAGGAAGSQITYRLVARNSGAVTLSNVVISDPMLRSLTGCTMPARLAPGAELICAGSYELTQADVDRGLVQNTARAAGLTPSGAPVNGTASVDYPTVAPSSALDLVKTGVFVDGNGDGNAQAGEQITYSFVVRNLGNITLTAVEVSDPKLSPAVIASGVTLAPQESRRFTRSHVLTQADVDAGAHSNQAIARGTPPTGPEVTDPSGPTPGTNTPTIVPLTATPSMSLRKTASAAVDANGSGRIDAGDTISYSFEVRNTGTVTLRDLALRDPLLPGLDGRLAELAPAAVWTLDASNTPSAVYTLTQADIDAERRDNEAVLTAQPALPGSPVLERRDTATVALPSAPRLDLVKTATLVDTNGNGFADSGEEIAYSFTLTNIGNVNLTSVTITDPMFTPAEIARAASLAPGAQLTASAVLVLTQPMIDAGVVRNTALASGLTPDGRTSEDPSGPTPGTDAPTVVDLPSQPQVRLVKTAALQDANGNGLPDIGEALDYTFDVTNTGTVTLKDLVITDPRLAASPFTLSGSLAAGQSRSLAGPTTRYLLTDTDMTAGHVENSARVTAMPPSGPPVTDISGTTVDNNTPTRTDLAQAPSLALRKTGPATLSGAAAGDVITYGFTVSNTGNVALRQVEVTDPLLRPSQVGMVAALAVGASQELTARYRLSQADIDRGEVVNTASATAVPPSGGALPPVTDRVTTALTSRADLSLSKEAETVSVRAVGDIARFVLRLTNTGSVTLGPTVTVTDPTARSLVCDALPAGGLAPGASLRCVAEQVTTQADMDQGELSNTAQAATSTLTPDPATSVPVVSLPASARVPSIQSPAISVDKTSNWQGNDVTLLVPPGVPSLFVAGETITYTYVVTNTGNTVLRGPLRLDDNRIPFSAFSCAGVTPSSVALEPGDTITCTADYRITRVDAVNIGRVTNNVIASIGSVKSRPDQVTVPNDLDPTLSLTKRLISGDGFSAVGDTLVWRFTVRNSGQATLGGNIMIHDALLPEPLQCLDVASRPSGFMPYAIDPALGEAICEATYRVTQEDIDRGHVLNRAYASSIYLPGSADELVIDSPWSEARAEAAGAPAMVLTKTVTPANGARLGDVLSYRIRLHNTGNQSLSNASISDPMLTGMSCAPALPATLAPGADLICAGQVRVTQADIDRGEIVNTATARAMVPGGDGLSASATVTHRPEAARAVLDLVKTGTLQASGATAKPGDQISLEFTLRNIGNVTLVDLQIDDPKLSAAPLATGLTLAPGESLKLTRLVDVDQAMIDLGAPYENQAFAQGKTPDGGTVDDPSGPTPQTNRPTEVPLPAQADLRLDKEVLRLVEANGNGRLDAGDQVEFRLVITNSGSVTLRDVVLDDPMLGGRIFARAVLAPGATVILTSAEVAALRYVLTQADIDAGRVDNTATLSGRPGSSTTLIQTSDSATEVYTPISQISLVKTARLEDANGNSAADRGEVIVYGFEVRNLGVTTLTNVEVSDPMFTPALIATITTMAPGAVETLAERRYTLTEEDIARGEIRNVATVTAKTGNGGVVTDTSGTDGGNDSPTDVTLNRPPVAGDDLSSGHVTNTPVTVEVIGNDSDPDGDLDRDVVQIVGPSGPVSTLVVPGEGTWTTGRGSVTFTPEAGFTADPTPIRYTIGDFTGARSNEAEVVIQYDSRPPVARDDESRDNPRGPVTVAVLANDTDPDGSLDPTSVRIDGAPGDGKTLVVPGEGTWTVHPTTGAVTFKPLGLEPGEPIFTKEPTPISYSLRDTDGNLSNLATVTVTYQTLPPIAEDDILAEPQPFGTVVRVDVLANDHDPDGELDPTSVLIQGADGDGKTLVVSGEGSWSVDPATGAISFTPESGFYGDPSPIRYTVKDNDGNISPPARVGFTYVLDPQLELTAEVLRIEDSSGDGLQGPDDRIFYRFTLRNPGLIPLTGVQIDPTTILISGQSGLMPGLSCRAISLAPGETVVLDCSNASHLISQEQADQRQIELQATASGTDPRGTVVTASGSVTSRVEAGEGLSIEKKAGLGSVRSGQLVPYTITVTNRSRSLNVVADVRDDLPAGFIYRKTSGRVGTLVQEPERAGSRLIFRDVMLAPGASVTIELQALVTGSVQPGSHTNRAQAFNPVTGRPNSPVARATVLVEADPIFDCGTVIGTVFDDRNMDGYQNPGEPGIPGVRLVTVRGTVITTDRFGRYNVPCADLPRDIGTNFVLKIDDRTLPSGYRMTTENPGDVRLTAGKMVELNFGASLARLVRLDIDARAFGREHGEEVLRAELRKGLADMAGQIRRTPSVLRVIYIRNGEADRQIKLRLRLIEEELRRVWRGEGAYALYLETMIQSRAGGGKK